MTLFAAVWIERIVVAVCVVALAVLVWIGSTGPTGSVGD
jgi:hypothetical protein